MIWVLMRKDVDRISWLSFRRFSSYLYAREGGDSILSPSLNFTAT